MPGPASSPAYARGREDHERRNAARLTCPPSDLDSYDESQFSGPWMYRRGWSSVEDAPPHSCPRCTERRPVLTSVGPGSDSPAVDDWHSGAVDTWGE